MFLEDNPLLSLKIVQMGGCKLKQLEEKVTSPPKVNLEWEWTSITSPITPNENRRSYCKNIDVMIRVTSP
jgi:hypothetical protein